jgi:hypothetical protein
MPHRHVSLDLIVLEPDEYFELKLLTTFILVTEIRIDVRTRSATFTGPDRRDMSPHPKPEHIWAGLDDSSEFPLLEDIVDEPKYSRMVRGRYNSLRLS